MVDDPTDKEGVVTGLLEEPADVLCPREIAAELQAKIAVRGDVLQGKAAQRILAAWSEVASAGEPDDLNPNIPNNHF